MWLLFLQRGVRFQGDHGMDRWRKHSTLPLLWDRFHEAAVWRLRGYFLFCSTVTMSPSENKYVRICLSKIALLRRRYSSAIIACSIS